MKIGKAIKAINKNAEFTYEKENLKSIVPQGIENTGGEPRYIIPTDCKEMYNISMFKYSNKIKDFFNLE